MEMGSGDLIQGSVENPENTRAKAAILDFDAKRE